MQSTQVDRTAGINGDCLPHTRQLRGSPTLYSFFYLRTLVSVGSPGSVLDLVLVILALLLPSRLTPDELVQCPLVDLVGLPAKKHKAHQADGTGLLR
jgi:hypothetical protein